MAALLAVVAVSGIAAVSAVSVQDGWMAVYVPDNDGEYLKFDAYVWNPNNYNITNTDPEKELIITESGHWDIVDGINTINELIVNGETPRLNQGEWVLPLLYLEEQITKIQKFVKLHDSQIEELQEKNQEQDKKIKALEKRIKALENPPNPSPGNLPPLP